MSVADLLTDALIAALDPARSDKPEGFAYPPLDRDEAEKAVAAQVEALRAAGIVLVPRDWVTKGLGAVALSVVTYDAEADAAFIYLKGSIEPGEIKRTVSVDDNINLDFDSAGYLIGIELLSGELLHPDLALIARRLRPAEEM